MMVQRHNFAIPSWRSRYGLLLLIAASAQAQQVPDAGALRQQIERGLQEPLPGRAAPLAPAEPPPLRLSEDMTLQVQGFRFAGNTLLTEPQLQAAVQGFVGRRLGFTELQQAAQAVATLYREAGWIVRAYLPAQDVTQGLITIQVVEAVFAGTQVSEPTPERIRPAQLQALVAAQQPEDMPVSAAALDRALLLADDLPGVTVIGALEAGAREGSTALVLTARDEPWLSGELSLDNAGSRSTGAPRIVALVRAASPTRRGDQVRVDLLRSEGTSYGRVLYSLPVGADGWRASFSASAFDYKLVGADFAALQAKGRSASAGAELTYPLLRTRLRNVYVHASYDLRHYRNEANSALQSRYQVHNLGLGLSANLYDEWGGGASSAAELTLTRGQTRQGQLQAAENPAQAGGFAKLRYSLSRQQSLAAKLSLLAALSGQLANKSLDSSERFYLGGPQGVRAYPINEASGTRGQLLNLELRWRAGASVVLSGFYDWGRVSGGAAAPADATLKGYGVAATWSGPHGVNVQAVLAQRHGDNPHPTPNGRDQDGSLHRTRIWLNASLSF